MELPKMRPVDTPPVTPVEPWWRRRPGLIWLLVGLAGGAAGDAAGLEWWQKSLIALVLVLAFEVWSRRRDVARRRPPPAGSGPGA